MAGKGVAKFFIFFCDFGTPNAIAICRFRKFYFYFIFLFLQKGRCIMSTDVAVVKVVVEGTETTLYLDSKVFSSRSTGYYCSGKISTPMGRYQTSIILTLIGSKPVKPGKCMD